MVVHGALQRAHEELKTGLFAQVLDLELKDLSVDPLVPLGYGEVHGRFCLVVADARLDLGSEVQNVTVVLDLVLQFLGLEVESELGDTVRVAALLQADDVVVDGLESRTGLREVPDLLETTP